MQPGFLGLRSALPARVQRERARTSISRQKSRRLPRKLHNCFGAGNIQLAMHLKVVALEDARFFWISLGPGAPAAVFVPAAFALTYASAAVAVSAVDAA